MDGYDPQTIDTAKAAARVLAGVMLTRVDGDPERVRVAMSEAVTNTKAAEFALAVYLDLAYSLLAEGRTPQECSERMLQWLDDLEERLDGARQ